MRDPKTLGVRVAPDVAGGPVERIAEEIARGLYFDRARRAWGIAFETDDERRAYRPEERLRYAPLGGPTPPRKPLKEQVWSTYAPVGVTSADRAVAALFEPERWPDYTSELGRFTPVRSRGLLGQTFEIEVSTHLTTRIPTILRGYVTATRLLDRDRGKEELDQVDVPPERGSSP